MFVFVPGPDDPSPGPVLPQAPLPSYFSAQLQEQLPNAVFTSNPCRIQYRAQEIVVFRWGPAACLPAQVPSAQAHLAVVHGHEAVCPACIVLRQCLHHHSRPCLPA
jgi:hypothetical protein